MLIKNNSEDIIKEISVNIEFSFAAVKPYLANEATDFVKNVLGSSLYKALDQAYADAAAVDDMEEKYRVLLPLAQRPLVYFGYLKYLPFGDVQITDGGISVKTSDTTAPASAKRVQNVTDSLTAIAWNSLEKLIKFLYANADVYDWDSSNTFSKWIGSFVNFSDNFNSWCTLDLSFELFNKLRPSIRFVEQNKIKTLIYDELFDKLIEQQNANLFEEVEVYDWSGSGSGSSGSGSGDGSGSDSTNLENHKKLLQFIQPAVVNLALAHGLASHRISISALGITEKFTNSAESVVKSDPVRNEVLASAYNRFLQDGAMYLKQLKDYLIENTDDYPLYEDAEEFDEEETVDDSTFENEEDNKFFGFL